MSERPYEHAKRLLAEGKGTEVIEPFVSPAEVEGLLNQLEVENESRKARLNEIAELLKAAITKDIENANLDNEVLTLTKQWLEKKLNQ